MCCRSAFDIQRRIQHTFSAKSEIEIIEIVEQVEWEIVEWEIVEREIVDHVE